MAAIPFSIWFWPLLASLLSTIAIERICHWLQVYDLPAERKLHQFPVPRLGGFTFLAVPFAACWVFSIPVPLSLLTGGLFVFAGGLYDDLHPANSAWVKLIFQIPACFLFAALMPLDWAAFTPAAELGIRFMSFGFVLFMTNAFNLMDNMNGLTAGIAMVIAASLIALNGELSAPLMLLALSVLGFYFRNFPRGRIYMGDQGSQWLGFMLSASSLLIIPSALGPHEPALIGKTAAVLVLLFGLFLADVTRVVWIRRSLGRPVWVGDQNHLSHRLASNGLGPIGAVLVLTGLQLILAVGSLGLLRMWRGG